MKIIGSFPKTRLRRLRKSKWIRDLVSENNISANDLILPIFVREGRNKIESIKSMPGINRYTVDKLPIILNQVKKFSVLCYCKTSKQLLEQLGKILVLKQGTNHL